MHDPLSNARNHHRASAHELALEMKVNQLYQAVGTMALAVRAALPQSNIPDPAMLFQGQGPTLSYYEQVSDQAMLAGRGPRFVALYNLAESDAERQALLDTIPSGENGLRSVGLNNNIENLTADYPFEEYRNGRSANNGVAAPEFMAWLSKARETGQFVPIEGDDLRTLAEPASVSTPLGIHLFSYTPAPTARRDSYGRAMDPLVHPAKEIVVVRVSDLAGYVIIDIDEVNYNSNVKRWVPRYSKWVVWCDVERKWCLTDGSFFPEKYLTNVAERFLKLVGMPKLDVPSTEEQIQAATDLCEYIKVKFDEWDGDLKQYGPVSARKVTLPGVMTLHFRGESSWCYSRVDRIHYQMHDPRLVRKRYAPEHSACWGQSGQLAPLIGMQTDHNGTSKVSGSLGVSIRHWRAVVDNFNKFTQADPSALVIEDTPNEDYHPEPVVAD